MMGGERRWQGGRCVDHQHVAGLEQAGKVGEAVVGELAARAGHEQPHVVAAEAALLGRRTRLGGLGEGEAHAGAGASSRAR